MEQKATSRVKDLRADKRTRLQANIELRRFGNSCWQYRGSTTDISSRGLGVEVLQVFAVGEVVELRFIGPEHSGSYRVRVVYRNNQYHYGMQFLDAVDISAIAAQFARKPQQKAQAAGIALRPAACEPGA